MAAGIGSRYGSLKQIDPVGPSGETIIDYSVFDAIRAGFGKIVFIIRKDIENDFKDVFLSRLGRHIPVEYVFQELDKLPDGICVPEGRVKPWGTGHAILMAKDLIREPFAAVNADDFYGAGAFQVMAQYLTSSVNPVSTDFAMVGYDLENTMSEFGSVSRGICSENGNGWLRNVVEHTCIQFTTGGIADLKDSGEYLPLKGTDIVSMNFWGFTPAYFTLTEPLFRDFIAGNLNNPRAEFYIPYAVDRLINSGKARVKVLHSHDRWFGVTYKEDKPLVIEKIRQLTQSGIYPETLWT